MNQLPEAQEILLQANQEATSHLSATEYTLALFHTFNVYFLKNYFK